MRGVAQQCPRRGGHARPDSAARGCAVRKTEQMIEQPRADRATAPTGDAWEMQAQAGIGKSVEAMPPVIADTLLDYFDVAPKPGMDLTAID